MRKLLSLALISVASFAQADRLINIPVARALRLGEIKGEALWEITRPKNADGYLGFGLGTNFDAEIHTRDTDGRRRIGTLDLSYNLHPPLVDIAPGISFGVLDALNRTREGRRAYMAVTFRNGLATQFTDLAADITIGVSQGRRTLPFVGITLPFRPEAAFLFEHDGLQITTGLEVRPIAPVAIRFLFQDQHTLTSVSYDLKF